MIVALMVAAILLAAMLGYLALVVYFWPADERCWCGVSHPKETR